jgi:hypothetical protein
MREANGKRLSTPQAGDLESTRWDDLAWTSVQIVALRWGIAVKHLAAFNAEAQELNN